MSPQWERELELNSASDCDNDSKEDDSCTASDSIAWRDHTDASTFSSEDSFEYHEQDIWNPMLESLCHSEVRVVMEALLDEVDMGRIALSCHISLDVLCD